MHPVEIDTRLIVVYTISIILITVTTLISYLLFHTIAELFSIIIGAGIFIIAWNTRRMSNNNYLLFLGIAYLFIAALDLIHMLVFPGMSVIPGIDGDPPAQVWIAARFVESVTLLAAPMFFGKKMPVKSVIFSYTFVFTIFILALFQWDIFPACYVGGVGLTPFKIYSEYLISLVLLAAAVHLYLHRDKFERGVYILLLGAIGTSIAAEFAFTLYISAYDLSNMTGHLLKILSFLFVYKAIIETGLRHPLGFIFKDLKENESRLRGERDRAKKYLENAGVPMLTINSGGTINRMNRTGSELMKYDTEKIHNIKFFDLFFSPEDREEIQRLLQDIWTGKIVEPETVEYGTMTEDGDVRRISWHFAVVEDDYGNPIEILASGNDMTEFRIAQDAVVEANKKLNLLASTTRHDILNQINGMSAFIELLDEVIPNEPTASKYLHYLKDAVATARRQIKFTGDYQDMGLKTATWQNVEYTFKRAAESLGMKEIRFNVQTGPLEIYADPMLEKAFFNLLDNTIRHGGDVTRIDVSFREKNGDAHLVVVDDGNGIPPSIREDIFAKGVGENTGYGLFLTKEILDITGISIEATGLEREGARFEMMVPIDKFRSGDITAQGQQAV